MKGLGFWVHRVYMGFRLPKRILSRQLSSYKWLCGVLYLFAGTKNPKPPKLSTQNHNLKRKRSIGNPQTASPKHKTKLHRRVQAQLEAALQEVGDHGCSFVVFTV